MELLARDGSLWIGQAAKPGAARCSPEPLHFRKSVENRGVWNPNLEKPVVLIVEEEVLIRMSAVHMVEDAGYAALEACNADAAIKILEARDDIRAVFTDINMSGSMDGLRLAHAIRRRWPPLHLIVTSGLDMVDKLPLNGRFIRKPYSAEHVTAALRKLFRSHPSPDRLLGDNGRNCGRVA